MTRQKSLLRRPLRQPGGGRQLADHAGRPARAARHPAAATSRWPNAASNVAQRNLDDTIVRAPFAGVVTVKAAQPGEIVSPISAGGGFTRTGIGTIVDMDSLEIQVDVNENFINRVQPGQQASGQAQRLSGLADPGTRDRRDSRPRIAARAPCTVRIATRSEGPAHPAGDGRARVLPGRRAAGRAGGKPAAPGVTLPANAVQGIGRRPASCSWCATASSSGARCDWAHERRPGRRAVGT